MSNRSETGRASRLSAFDDLINFLEGLQAGYNPPVDSLKIDHLKQVHERASQAHQVVSVSDAAYRVALNKRNETVKPLNGIVRSVVNLVMALGLANGQTPKVKSLAKAITGNVKLSQQSIEARMDHFNQFIVLIGSLDGYTPDRELLEIATLQSLHQVMKETNKELAKKESLLSSARLQRDVAFKGEDGLLQNTRRVKLYLRSLFGDRTDTYRQVIRITQILK